MNDKTQQIAEQPEDQRSVSMFERLARDPTVDVGKLEKLVELQERAEARSAKAAFAAAFARMQGEIPVITEGGEIKVGTEVRSRYARYEDIDRVMKPILQRNGFSLMHKREFSEKSMTIRSVLMHEGGHSEETQFVGAPDTTGSKNAIQAQGSTDAYGRRYNMLALLNIATGGQDDDGARTELVSEEQADTLDSLVKDAGADLKAFCKYFKVNAIVDLPAKAYNDAVAMLNAKKKRA